MCWYVHTKSAPMQVSFVSVHLTAAKTVTFSAVNTYSRRKRRDRNSAAKGALARAVSAIVNAVTPSLRRTNILMAYVVLLLIFVAKLRRIYVEIRLLWTVHGEPRR